MSKCWSPRFWFGPLLFIYSISIAIQYHAWARNNTIASDSTRFSVQQINAAPASRRLDKLLWKYNLTANYQSHYAKIRIPDANRSLAFLHIGKTAGSTISIHLRNGCREDNMIPCNNRKKGWIINETVASHRVKYYYHMEDIPLRRLNHLTTIVTAVRNPISRFLSAFAYGHPTNSMATKSSMNMAEVQKYTCFPSISYLIKAGMGEAEIPWNKAHMNKMRQVAMNRPGKKSILDDIPPINCTELAQVAFGLSKIWADCNTNIPWMTHCNTKHPWLNHMSFNYKRYYQSIPPDKELLAIRTDHLWGDWVNVNNLISDGNDAYKNWPNIPHFQEVHRNVSSEYAKQERWKVRTSQEQLWLCQLLHEEIRTYLLILMRSINLDDDDLLEAAANVDILCNG